jgi:hypothetical protein
MGRRTLAKYWDSAKLHFLGHIKPRYKRIPCRSIVAYAAPIECLKAMQRSAWAEISRIIPLRQSTV